MSSPHAVVLFDVDGTLVDSNYLHTVAWSRALHDAGEWAPMNAIHRLIGMGADNFLPALIGRVDDEITSAWRSHYEALIPEVRPFPGASELIRDLDARGVGVVLATSSPAEHLAHVVQLLALGPEIELATTGDDVERSKPDPEIFLMALHRSHGDHSRAIVVGDSTWDVEAAIAARLPCVAVESGGFSHAELMDAGALAVYRDVEAVRMDLMNGPLSRLIDDSR